MYYVIALVMAGILVTGPAVSSVYVVNASTTTEGDGGGGGGTTENDNQEIESNDDGGTEEGGTGEEKQPETEPEPEPETPPVVEEEPVTQPEAAVAPEPEPEVTDCPEGYTLSDIDTCVPEAGPAVPNPELPICDGSPQDCVTGNGDICLEGQGGHECECADDLSDCPNLPPVECPPDTFPNQGECIPCEGPCPETPPPTEEEPCPEGQFRTGPGEPCVDCEGPCPEVPPPTDCEDGVFFATTGGEGDGTGDDCPPPPDDTCPPGQFPVTPGDPSTCVDCEGPCPEPVPPGPDEDCLFNPSLPKCASDNGECPEGFFQNEDGNCVPDHPNGCPEGFHSHEDDETGQCIPDSVPCEPGFIRDPDFPTCSQKERVCQEHPNINACKNNDDNDNDDDVDITIINKVINIVKDKNKRGTGNFPEIDIIGLSTKKDGDSMVCLINIDKEHVQCQDFGMPSDRVNGDFWRVIETDQDKDYDNGNTGSSEIDKVIDDIKSQDFDELDDATNHDFNIDLFWVAINPSGEGVACLAQDSTGKGKSLCEPFKVSSEEIDGQITEGVGIKS
jgi:hypothetical protein